MTGTPSSRSCAPARSRASKLVSDNRYARTHHRWAMARGVVSVQQRTANRLIAVLRFPDCAACRRSSRASAGYSTWRPIPAAIGAHLRLDPKLAPLVAARPGLRVPGAWDGFELAVRAVLGQQITVVAASKLAGKLVAAYGEPLDEPAAASSGSPMCFPTPDANCLDRSRIAWHAECAARGTDLAGRRGRGRTADLRPASKSRSRDRTSALPGRHRRMDRAIHRNARVARARCISCCRYRSDARHGRCGR